MMPASIQIGNKDITKLLRQHGAAKLFNTLTKIINDAYIKG